MLREWGRRHQEIVHVGISLAPREKSSVQTLEAEVACSAQERDKVQIFSTVSCRVVNYKTLYFDNV